MVNSPSSGKHTIRVCAAFSKKSTLTFQNLQKPRPWTQYLAWLGVVVVVLFSPHPRLHVCSSPLLHLSASGTLCLTPCLDAVAPHFVIISFVGGGMVVNITESDFERQMPPATAAGRGPGSAASGSGGPASSATSPRGLLMKQAHSRGASSVSTVSSDILYGDYPGEAQQQAGVNIKVRVSKRTLGCVNTF